MFSVDSKKKKVKERPDHSKCLSLDLGRKFCSLREIIILNSNINWMWLYIGCRIKKIPKYDKKCTSISKILRVELFKDILME